MPAFCAVNPCPLPSPRFGCLRHGADPDSSCVVFGFSSSAKANCANGGCAPAYCSRTPSFRCGTRTTIFSKFQIRTSMGESHCDMARDH